MIRINGKLRVFFIVFVFMSLAQVLANASDIPVFPGAEGFGVYTPAGRGGTVYRVTNINSSGSGSLREAVEAFGSRVVIFEVSGTIEITSDLVISNPYITIAGQTAPSPGIQIKGAGIRIAGAHDVLIQHLRIRPGDSETGPNPDWRRAISINNDNGTAPYNVVIDHCSLQWGIDACSDIWTDGGHDITYRTNILSECLDDSIHSKGPHSKGMNINDNQDNISLIKNLFAQNVERNPRIESDITIEVINNVIYNSTNYNIKFDGSGDGPSNVSVVSCHSVMGLDSGNSEKYVIVIDADIEDAWRIYIDNLLSDNSPSSCVYDYHGEGTVWLESAETWSGTVSVISTDNNGARDWVLAHAGAWPAFRDSVDSRIVADVISGTGWIINSQDEVGGWPVFAQNIRPLYFPNNINGDDDGDGYTNLEEWVHVFTDIVEEGGFTLISGTVTIDGSGLEGVVMNGLPGNPTTDASGNYMARVDIDWSGTVIPTKSGYNFYPESITYSSVDSAETGQDYTATPISHTVSTPNIPSGPSSSGVTGTSYTYSTGGSSCSQGHAVEYQFDWGDGDFSTWSSSTSASHSWSNASTYNVKARARCSINNNIVSEWSSGKAVSIVNTSNFNLAISSATGSPAPGEGGTTDPSPGNHSYSIGSSVQVKAILNENYRFSKWTGDVSNSDEYNKEMAITMDKNKSISSYFCIKCGDVNGDLSITPADAQAAFDIFLGRISNPTDCEKENADVNSDGTKTEPNITPADAQAIFEKFLGKSELPSDCSSNSRTSSVILTQMRQTPNINLIINDIQVNLGEEISVPIIIDNPFNIKAFGFDLLFPSEILEFIGVEKTDLQKDFRQIDANEIADGVLRVGGYSSKPIMSHSPGVLVTLVFRVIGEAKEPTSLAIINTVDDIRNASVKNGRLIEKIQNTKHVIKEKDTFQRSN